MSRRIVGSREITSTRSEGRNDPSSRGGVAASASARSSSIGRTGVMWNCWTSRDPLGVDAHEVRNARIRIAAARVDRIAGLYGRNLPCPVLLVADLFHPLDRLPVEPFHDGDVCHGRGCGGAVPVLLAGRTPDDVTRSNFLDRASPALYESAAGGHDQRLAERMGVPCRPRAGLEGNTDAERASRIVRLKERVDPDSAGEGLGRSFLGRL